MLLALVPLMLMHYWVLVFGLCCAQLFAPSSPATGFSCVYPAASRIAVDASGIVAPPVSQLPDR